MSPRHALAAACLLLAGACGGKIADDFPTDAGKADVHAPHDAGVHDAIALDVAPPPYQPIGKACTPPDAGPPPTWTPDDAGAPVHAPVMHALGGPVLASPIFVPVTFDGDPLRGPIDDFVASVGCTSYWRSIATDYGVGDAYATPPVHLAASDAPASIDDTTFGPWLDQLLAAKALPEPVAGRTLYVFFFPETTQLALQGTNACQTFLGFHDEAQLTGKGVVSYAAIPRCGPFGTLDDTQTVTVVTSHELLEAATDPLPFSNPAYLQPEDDGIAWALVGGGEIGDMCNFDYGMTDYQSAYFQPADYPFWVQRQWSSRVAFLGHDPCQPSSQSVFFSAVPAAPDAIAFDLGWAKGTTHGVKLAVGQKTTIDVQLVADAPMSDAISVAAFDGSTLGDSASLAFSLAPSVGHVGDTLKLTITRTGSSSWYPVEMFALVATSGTVSRTWWGVVGNP